MTISMIFFFVSFMGIIVMMWVKSYEMKTGKTFLFGRLADKLDHKVQAAYSATKTFVSYFNRKSAVALIQWIAYHILSWARSFYIMMHKKAHAHPPSKKVIDMVRGKGDVENVGGASFYLKKIATDTPVVVK